MKVSRSYAGKGERDGEVWHDASDLVASKSDQNELTRLVVRTSDYVFQQRGGVVVTNRPQKRVFQKKLALEAPGEGHCGPHCRPYCRW